MPFSHGGNVYDGEGILQNWIDVSANINPLGLSVRVKEAIITAVDMLVHYPDPEARALKNALANHYGILKERLICTNGAAELMYIYFHTFKPKETRFYLRMTALVTARKLYRLMLLILLYVFHFLYLCVHYNDIGVVASTIAFAIFFVFMDVERWLQRLHEERTPFCIAALAAVVFVFTPHLFTLAVTISFVLLASLFYPSRIVISLWKNKADRKMLLEDTEMLIIYYY